jgi:hypothetical protein
MTHDNQAATGGSRRCWHLAVASCLAAVLAFATAFPLMMLGACAGWILAAVGTCLAVGQAWQAVRRRHDERRTAVRGHAWLAPVILALMLLGQTSVSLEALRAVQGASKANVSEAKLRGIGYAIAEYARQHGACPSEWNELVGSAPLVSPRQFLCDFDPDADRHHGEDVVRYSSYVYKPVPHEGVGDPTIVLAWERKPWSRPDARLWSEYKRWVLFADGKVRPLDATAFEEAIAKDDARRRERGWPTDVVYTPSTHPTSQQVSTRPAQRQR